MSAVKILVIPGSVRSGSHNARLAAVAAAALDAAGAEVTRLSLTDYALPLYDADHEARHGVPRPAIELKRMISAHDGLLLVTPEYNAAPPPLLLNALDWVTRVSELNEERGAVLRGRPVAIAAASEGRLGGVRALAALRLILTSCRAIVAPEQLALALAHEAYDDYERLKLAPDQAALDALARQLVGLCEQRL